MWEKIKKYCPIVFICALGAFVVLNLVIYFAGVLIYFDFVEFCNDNEGFFSALLGFLAILISVLTYYNQKKEQIKNAQENAKLQRELTEQNNKFQADLEMRQIKLESFNLRLECLMLLKALREIMNHFCLVIANSKYRECRYSVEQLKKRFEKVKKRYKIDKLEYEISKIPFVVKNEKIDLEQIIKDFSDVEYVLEKITLEEGDNQLRLRMKFFYYKINPHQKELQDIIKLLEEDLSIVDIHKF